ncbi:helix-turn-helix domain-containing protein [Streptomyces antibioticus]|uniref:helix-turn-helix domain-containing protein n=1 Tax=Streptomyces antibioticus TaxID=1890 RepID=UPI00369E6CB8
MQELAKRRDTAMNRRRLELGMTWRQVAAAAGVSYETLRAVRKGDSTGGELTLRSIERALRWAPPAFEVIDSGGEPAPADDAQSVTRDNRGGELPPLDRELELASRLLSALVRELELSPEGADSAWRAVKAQLERDHAEAKREAPPSGESTSGTG